MDEKGELKEELEQELQSVCYRQKMLDLIEEKLLQMRKLAERGKEEKLSPSEIEEINKKLNNLAVQIKALDEESRGIYDNLL